MKFEKSHTLKEIAEFLGIEFEGNPELPITGINEIHRVENGDLVFADHPKYIKKALESAASVLLINQSVSLPDNKAALISKNPFGDFKKLAEHFNKPTFWEEGKYKTGEGTLIHPSAVIASTVSIGKNCLIHPNVTIYENCIIGDHVEIHANTVIGGNAFYYQKKTDTYNRMYTCGRVIIEDDVEIGTLCSIDRGVTSDTIIGKGTKIDNQVHIGHDSILGQNCLLAAHVGVAGCVELGNNVTLWGQVGVKSDVRIGNNVVVMAQSGVHKDLEDNGIYFGSPIGSAKTKYREIAALKKLPEILENL